MTARFLLLIGLLGCASEPSKPPPKTGELIVPPMADAGPPPPPVRKSAADAAQKAAAEEPKLSYEAALARAKEAGPMVVDETDMTDAELSAPMRGAAFVPGCGAPNEMKLTVKVAVQRGRAAGVTVSTTPPNEAVARCVDEHIRRELRWPVRKKMDSFTVTY